MYQDILGIRNIKAISVGALRRRMNGYIGECDTIATINGYVSSWAISDAQVTNNKIVACMEIQGLHQSIHMKNHVTIYTYTLVRIYHFKNYTLGLDYLRSRNYIIQKI